MAGILLQKEIEQQDPQNRWHLSGTCRIFSMLPSIVPKSGTKGKIEAGDRARR
jgi:hypothetical protein